MAKRDLAKTNEYWALRRLIALAELEIEEFSQDDTYKEKHVANLAWFKELSDAATAKALWAVVEWAASWNPSPTSWWAMLTKELETAGIERPAQGSLRHMYYR